MTEAARTSLMNAEQFAVWEQSQTERHELVDGQPRLKFVEWDGPKMMTGATNRQNSIVAQLTYLLKSQLAGKKCKPYAADGKVRIPTGNIRYPDISIDCGPYDPEASVLAQPVAVIEVISKSTRWIDQSLKLQEYQTVPSMLYILLLMQDDMRGQFFTRGTAKWGMQEVSGSDSVVSLPEVGAQFTLGEAYEGAL